jgi:predicted deacetylase
MSARYIVRFDDICPTMNWATWSRIEPVLQAHGVKPIMAVVPDNRDPHLAAGDAASDFWGRVRRWQAQGWTIALHGHQHLYTTRDSGLVGVNPFSEFAGLPEATQREKLQRALAVFSREGLRADAWVAPGHSFDAVTLKVLLEFGIGVVSDGFYVRPLRHMGALWVPQQLWRFRSMPVGLWTVCYHCNRFDDAAIAGFASDIARFAERIVSLAEACAAPRIGAHNALDAAFAAAWRAALRMKHLRAAA